MKKCLACGRFIGKNQLLVCSPKCDLKAQEKSRGYWMEILSSK